MAQRAKGRYRGRAFTRQSLRPGKRTVRVPASPPKILVYSSASRLT